MLFQITQLLINLDSPIFDPGSFNAYPKLSPWFYDKWNLCKGLNNPEIRTLLKKAFFKCKWSLLPSTQPYLNYQNRLLILRNWIIHLTLVDAKIRLVKIRMTRASHDDDANFNPVIPKPLSESYIKCDEQIGLN